MIHVSYCGRLGNNLFQFAFGAVLSRLSDQPMTAPPIPGFPGTTGFVGSSHVDGHPIPLHGFTMDVGAWVERARRGDVVVHGYPHNTAYYEPNHSWLAPMLAPAPGAYANGNANDIVLHLRLGDYFSTNRSNIDRFGYPVEAIHKLLGRLAYARCLIVTDTPKHDAVARLVRERRGLVFSGDRMHDYRTLYHARRLIMSPSTFSWWAAWSGRATEIWFPHEIGYWQTKHNCQLAIPRPDVRRYDAQGELVCG